MKKINEMKKLRLITAYTLKKGNRKDNKIKLDFLRLQKIFKE